MRSVGAGEAAALVAALGQDTSRLPGFAWSLPHLAACTDGKSICLHRGVSFADDWVRESWVVAPEGERISATRRACTHLFASGARQLRWRLTLPFDLRYEAAFVRYGVRPIALTKNELTVALDDPSLPRSRVKPWPTRLLLGAGLSVGVVRFGEIPRIAELFQRPKVHQALGYWRGATVDELMSYLIPHNPLFHARPSMHVYAVRRSGLAVGFVVEHARNYDGDAVREIDMVLEDEAVPLRTWAELLATVCDLCFRRGATRIVVNVREDFPTMAEVFGAEKVTSWITDPTARRTYYTATAAQFYASVAARLYASRRGPRPVHHVMV